MLPNSKIFSAFISIVFAICLVIYMKKSKLGRAIRATAQNARAAKILGVDTEKVYAATFGINAALCGVAGALISITFTIHPYMGLPYTIRSFMIVIIAGLGNLPGVAVSGMGLGVFEEFADTGPTKPTVPTKQRLRFGRKSLVTVFEPIVKH